MITEEIKNRFSDRFRDEVVAEHNDEPLRTKLVHTFDLMVEECKFDTLNRYKIVCDETNNTPEVLYNNGAVMDIVFEFDGDVDEEGNQQARRLHIELFGEQVEFDKGVENEL